MRAYAALLRGVNVPGGIRMPNEDLRILADKLQLGQPRPFLASGNLLFLSSSPADHLKDKLEQALRGYCSTHVTVTLRTCAELNDTVQANPFTDASDRTVQVFFLEDPPRADLLESVRNMDDERVALGAREVYVAYGKKGIGRSRLRIPAAEAGTARNMRTVARLAKLAREMS